MTNLHETWDVPQHHVRYRLNRRLALKAVSFNADLKSMSVSGISGSGFVAIAGGVQAQFKSMVLKSALNDAGLLDANLDQGIKALEAAGRSTAAAGLIALQAQTVGQLLDIFA